MKYNCPRCCGSGTDPVTLGETPCIKCNGSGLVTVQEVGPTTQEEIQRVAHMVTLASSPELAAVYLRGFVDRITDFTTETVKASNEVDARRTTEELNHYKAAMNEAHDLIDKTGISGCRERNHTGLTARIKALLARNKHLLETFERMRDAEKKLSDAYIRVRKILGIEYFTAGTTPEQMWVSVEAAATAVMQDREESALLVKRLQEMNDAQKLTIRNLRDEVEKLESDNRYNTTHLTKLAKQVGRLGESSGTVVTVAVAQLIQHGAKAKQWDEARAKEKPAEIRREIVPTLAKPGTSDTVLAVARTFDLYNELIYAVAQHFPGETRHATALRYIREREERATEGPAVAESPKA